MTLCTATNVGCFLVLCSVRSILEGLNREIAFGIEMAKLTNWCIACSDYCGANGRDSSSVLCLSSEKKTVLSCPRNGNA